MQNKKGDWKEGRVKVKVELDEETQKMLKELWKESGSKEFERKSNSLRR